MHNFVDNTKNHSQTLDFTTNFFLWILGISTCVWWITLWITVFVFIFKQSYPHYPQFYMPYPLLSYPHSIHSFFPLIHMLSTCYPQPIHNIIHIFLQCRGYFLQTALLFSLEILHYFYYNIIIWANRLFSRKLPYTDVRSNK